MNHLKTRAILFFPVRFIESFATEGRTNLFLYN